MTAVLLDTGPLIAVVDRDDKHHLSCLRLLESASGPLLLPTTVLIEAGWIINRHMGASVHAQFLDLVTEEFELVNLIPADVRRMAQLVRLYRDSCLDPADVSVVAIAERLSITHIATLDRRDFSLVRPRHVVAFTLLPEKLS
ncbi:VapC toxin family PIN domain ribonuclease [Nonomuraea sp. WAC 01424]|uniref:type II toxin-antitoxin system VapC family toxin n=1 Tax=Nonomuraea sp. WAC 01424 TaxID=2203200 RepID=UPI000F7A8E46|nr:PIN domain-containing protein [Nonomuraea sp. WAC 01424]RSN14309.1 VapC toxin family PIN domain ribonuclease [Nonomuraea sp. WAC 01424]